MWAAAAVAAAMFGSCPAFALRGAACITMRLAVAADQVTHVAMPPTRSWPKPWELAEAMRKSLDERAAINLVNSTRFESSLLSTGVSGE